MNDLGLYLRYIGLSARSQLQYRVSFVLQTLGHGLLTAHRGSRRMGALSPLRPTARIVATGGCACFTGRISLTFAIADAFRSRLRSIRQHRESRQLRPLAPSAPLDRVAIDRPGADAAPRRQIRSRSRGAGAGPFRQCVKPGRRRTAVLLLLAVFGGVCLFTGLVVLQATSAFWTTESLEVWNAFTYGGVFMSQYPIAIYRPWFRQFFTYAIPLACVNYFPCWPSSIGGILWGVTMLFEWLAPLAGVALLMAACKCGSSACGTIAPLAVEEGNFVCLKPRSLQILPP